MKRSTTISVTKKVKEKAAFIIVVLFVIGGVISLIAPSLTDSNQVFANADRLQDQLDAIEEEMEKNEEAAEHTHQIAETLKDAVTNIESEVRTLELQIEKSTLEKKNLEVKIVETQKKIVKNQEMLAQTVSDLYVDSDMTPIEMLASSQSIGDYVDKQEYRNAVRDQVSVAITTVKKLKADLEEQKEAVKEVLARQKDQESQLVAKRDEKSQLLAETRGQERKYKQKVEELKQEREETMAALEEALRSSSSASAAFNLVGQGAVSAGSIVGRAGNTGLSFGCHLHLEVRVNGSITDPSSYLSQPGWVMPTNAGVTQSYGNADPIYASGYHPGVDYGAMCGSPIVAASDGVLERGWLGAYGCAALVDHGGGVVTLYGHLSPDSCS